MTTRPLVAFVVVGAFTAVLAMSGADAAPSTRYREHYSGGATTNQAVRPRPGTECLERYNRDTGALVRVLVPEGATFASCTPVVSTTTAVTTTTSATTSTTAPPPTTTTLPPAGTFTETFSGTLDGWTFAHRRYENPANSDAPSTATIVGGQARINAFDQNYGDATLRSAVKYDLTNGGIVLLDMTDDSGGDTLLGFANVSFSANPDDAKASMADERVEPYAPADMPTNALQIQLRTNCRVPWGPPVAVRYLTATPGGRTVHQGNCAATPDGRWRLVFTAGHVSIRNGANAEVVGYDVTVPATGWFILGVHNHASDKYGSRPSIIGLFDNVSYPTGGNPPPPSTSSSTTTTSVPPTTTPVTTVIPTTSAAPSTTTTLPPPAGLAFSEQFLTAAGVARFDFQLHTSSNGNQPVPIEATFLGEHDTGCHGPDTFRTVNGGQHGSGLDMSGSELIWWCAPTGDPASGHFMTALDTTGVATLSFSPKQSFTNVRKVCWSQNMNNLGEAKWLNVFVVPAADVASKGGNLNYASGTGLPFGGDLQLLPAGAFDFTWLRGSIKAHQVTAGGSYNQILDVWGAYPANMEPTSAPRHPICIEDLENGTIRYSVYQTGTASVQTYTSPGSLPNGSVKVIIQDASYNPTKHAGFDTHLTWHWDDIAITAG